MTAQVTVKLAIYGPTGFIGSRHLFFALKSSSVQLTAFIDPSPLAVTLTEEHAVPLFKTHDEFLQALKSEEVRVEAVVLATPTGSHVPLSLDLLGKGLTILVEKPISGDSASAQLLVDAARKSQNGGKVVIGHHRRFNPYLLAAKRLVSSGQLGEILAISGLWALSKPLEYFSIPWHVQPGAGGPILTNMIHEIDDLQYLLGRVERVYVEEGKRTRGHKVEETVAMTMRFEGGAVGTFVLSDAALSPYAFEASTGENVAIAYTGEPSLFVMGTKGSFSLPELTRYHLDTLPSSEAHWSTAPLRDTRPLASVDSALAPLAEQLEHLVRVVRGEEEPNCTAEQGASALRVLEAMFVSMQEGRAVMVEHPRQEPEGTK